ncbi:uncharacterized protein CYBJADRAFT_169271 [Cyberlindnera jadinii NRRL Y-1542]|uniref:Uncharacterized protein n=1 Tax=Cyberlindnera jadinii (strain ATCC 18201 / CBS 1600 / BCRC 20928 / JCM 3617 / NBRC 0987 / NRRL Y-1542) TaxID=983966 RepID=A0A1E4RX36_CYBJN|nr:hypothetical protein CYBJADRAFT_169271 [Cyberlindnera jadinii NRRL Y-1542]ODV71645.1 hypothetical protein CYBJADRAFT_169271 [Cyberlindnera jadinii NRRL Y-1542]
MAYKPFSASVAIHSLNYGSFNSPLDLFTLCSAPYSTQAIIRYAQRDLQYVINHGWNNLKLLVPW